MDALKLPGDLRPKDLETGFTDPREDGILTREVVDWKCLLGRLIKVQAVGSPAMVDMFVPGFYQRNPVEKGPRSTRNERDGFVIAFSSASFEERATD